MNLSINLLHSRICVRGQVTEPCLAELYSQPHKRNALPHWSTSPGKWSLDSSNISSQGKRNLQWGRLLKCRFQGFALCCWIPWGHSPLGIMAIIIHSCTLSVRAIGGKHHTCVNVHEKIQSCNYLALGMPNSIYVTKKFPESSTVELPLTPYKLIAATPSLLQKKKKSKRK